MTFLELLLGAVALVVGTVFAVFARGRDRSVKTALEQAGFAPDGFDTWVRPGAVSVTARIDGDAGFRKIVLVGPELPEGVPELQSTAEPAPPGRPVVASGDDRFDKDVRAMHTRGPEALGWLTQEVRTQARRAVRAGVTLRRRRWQVELDQPDAAELKAASTAVERASAAMAEGPEDPIEAVRALLLDASPGVRVQALHALVDRVAIHADELDRLARGPYGEVHVAVVALGGEPARIAFQRLRKAGSRSQQAEGAVELYRAWKEQRVRLDEGDLEELVDELVESLADPTFGERVAKQLEALGRADLLPRLAEAYGEDAPPWVRTLRRALLAAHGDAARGAVSLVDDQRGGLSVARPPKTPEG